MMFYVVLKPNSYLQWKGFYSWKEALWLVLPYLETISRQTRTKLQISIKEVLKCCELQVIFKIQNKLCNKFCFKNRVSQILTSGVAYKFQCGLCNEFCYRECVRHLALRSGEHIGISSLTNKRIQPRNDNAVCHHLLICNYSPTFEDFSVLCHENKKYLLELKENVLIMRDQWIGTYLAPLSICLNEFL